MRDFRNIDAWHKAHAFTLRTYLITENFPKAETYGLAATLRRGSAHLTMKIAEACGKDTVNEFSAVLSQARGLGMEVEYQLLLARDIQFLKVDDYAALQSNVIEVRKMLSGLMKTAMV